jgi:hypothetical protein
MISGEWKDPQKPRIAKIRDMLSRRGVSVDFPYIQVKDGARTIYAYPDSVCLAILEYYAFDAGLNCKFEARNNFGFWLTKLYRFHLCPSWLQPEHYNPRKLAAVP